MLYYTWKLCSVVFSHFVMISLVVAYCILGAVTFEKLEAQHEKEVRTYTSSSFLRTVPSCEVACTENIVRYTIPAALLKCL